MLSSARHFSRALPLRASRAREMSFQSQQMASDVKPRKKQTIASLRAQTTPITMLTAYDFPTARACAAHGVDIILVGDSLAQVCLGYEDTTRLTLDEMLHHCRAVARGIAAPLPANLPRTPPVPFMVADMPFGTYHASTSQAISNAVRMIQSGHAQALKIEGTLEILPTVKALSEMGIPVMGHVGLMPQRATALSGYRVQGRTAESAREILHAALSLEKAGAFSMLLECVPTKLGAYITSRLKIPTIGIGAGPHTTGQVLVWSDAMNMWEDHKAKFARGFADVGSEVQKGITAYSQAVVNGSFPNSKEVYAIPEVEWTEFMRLEGESSVALKV